MSLVFHRPENPKGPAGREDDLKFAVDVSSVMCLLRRMKGIEVVAPRIVPVGCCSRVRQNLGHKFEWSIIIEQFLFILHFRRHKHESWSLSINNNYATWFGTNQPTNHGAKTRRYVVLAWQYIILIGCRISVRTYPPMMGQSNSKVCCASLA